MHTLVGVLVTGVGGVGGTKVWESLAVQAPFFPPTFRVKRGDWPSAPCEVKKQLQGEQESSMAGPNFSFFETSVWGSWQGQCTP